MSIHMDPMKLLLLLLPVHVRVSRSVFGTFCDAQHRLFRAKILHMRGRSKKNRGRPCPSMFIGKTFAGWLMLLRNCILYVRQPLYSQYPKVRHGHACALNTGTGIDLASMGLRSR